MIPNSHELRKCAALTANAEHTGFSGRWNDTRRDYPRDRCVHELFEEQARKTPLAAAVAFEGRQLSYGELDLQAERLARRLRKLGVQPEVPVAFCLDRSPAMLVAMLGTMKAGGTYVPLEPEYPDGRLTAILTAAQPAVLVTSGVFHGRFLGHAGARVLLGAEPDAEVDEECAAPTIGSDPESLAYIIFTSGSTGTPKGVLVAHRSVVNHGFAIARAYALRPGDRVLQFASCSFDVAAEEIFPTLLSGATVVLWRKDTGVLPVHQFLEFVEEQEITVLNLPAAYWHEWVSSLDETRVPPRLRLVIVGSEKVSIEKFSVWRNRVGTSVRLLNAYGPTEATITATLYEPSDTPENAANDCMPIGRPIDNTQVFVLDPRLLPVPPGTAGELYIGGACLARGYLDQPELTAERFLADPFSPEAGARMYRTGDLARLKPDGVLEYLGRIDDQVKLRGFRIELGEIEAAINRCAGVRESAVVVREDSPGDKRLVAYVIHNRPSEISAGALRNDLRKQLPEYMVPSAFVPLESFPLTPGGKIDRRSLPAPAGQTVERRADSVAPRSDAERQLAEVWAKLLGARAVGVHDNFFELGGNSLLALRLVTYIEKNFGVRLTVAVLYEAPTIAQLAGALNRETPMLSHSALVSLQPAGTEAPFFWIHGETSDAFLPRHLGPDQPVYGLRHQSEDGQPARYTTVEEIARRHLDEIRTVQPRGPYFLGGYCFGALIAFEIAQQLQREREGVELLALLAPDTPGNHHPAGVIEPSCAHPGWSDKWSDKMARRLSTFKALGPRQKLAYAGAGVCAKFKEMVWLPTVQIAKRAACRFYLAVGRPLPIGLRSRYILDVYGRAVSRYVPEIYPGRIVIFKPAQDFINLETWRTLAAAGLEVVEIPGGHEEVVNNESHVRMWAERLKSYLDQAQVSGQASSARRSGPPDKHSQRAPLPSDIDRASETSSGR